MGRVLLLAILVIGIVGGVTSHTHAAVDRARIESARKAVLESEYQPTHPRYAEGDKGTPRAEGSGARNPAQRAPTGDGRYQPPDRMSDTRERRMTETGSGIATYVLWGLLIVGVIVLIAGAITELTDREADPQIANPETQERMQAAVDAILHRPLGDADELAARGEFAEAIHTLLLQTLRELVKTAAIRVTPSMTSREILARLPMLADARDAFAGLITAVEVTHFGDEPAGATDYQRCREQFNVFAAALRAGLAKKAA